MPEIDLSDLARRLTRDEVAELVARHAASYPWPPYGWDLEARVLEHLVDLKGSIGAAADAWGIHRNTVTKILNRIPTDRRKA